MERGALWASLFAWVEIVIRRRLGRQVYGQSIVFDELDEVTRGRDVYVVPETEVDLLVVCGHAISLRVSAAAPASPLRGEHHAATSRLSWSLRAETRTQTQRTVLLR